MKQAVGVRSVLVSIDHRSGAALDNINAIYIYIECVSFNVLSTFHLFAGPDELAIQPLGVLL